MNIINRLTQIFLINEIRTILKWNKYQPVNKIPHGHFYSPIVSKNEINSYSDQIWEIPTQDFIPGIDLNVKNQLLLVEEFCNYYSDLPFGFTKSDQNRYYFNNESYAYTDAIILYSFIRHFIPNRIIEIGSGFSSAVMLDTKDVLRRNIDISFIEPYPNLLHSLFKDNDKSTYKVFATKVQDIEIDFFRNLDKNDILFIDSSHVSKTGSDVNYEIFQILPSLKSGVIIHFHDIFYPFEYPREWVYEGRNWNEIYLLKAFLSYNNSFEILFFSQYLHTHHSSAFEKMPLTYKNRGGNLWIRKK